jgi:hypothetical protein
MVRNEARLVVWICIISAGGNAQRLKSDAFLAAIEAIKHSVGSMDCLAVNGTEAKLLKRIATAFLVSDSGDFLTAAHVLEDMRHGDDSCPTPAITLAMGDWRPEAATEKMLWFPFETANCKIQGNLDIAACKPSGSLQARIRKSIKVTPVQFEWNTQADGAQLAFTGFPLEARDPMTFRAYVAAYRILTAGEPTTELILDHASLPGFSGSPVYTADGKVVAILTKDGKPEAPGISIARPISAIRDMITTSSAK